MRGFTTVVAVRSVKHCPYCGHRLLKKKGSFTVQLAQKKMALTKGMAFCPSCYELIEVVPASVRVSFGQTRA
jgi:uncharacterized protein with PIN domain